MPALLLLAGVLLIRPGVFSVDESHYLLAAQSASRGSFCIENGYEVLKHPSLLYFYTVVPEEVQRLGSVATVPFYHSLLAAPFLAVGGASGLVWLNLLSFFASALAVRRMALLLGADGRFSFYLMFAFVIGGMSLEYAFGIWPHALSQALVLWMLVIFLSARKTPWLFFTAAFLGGMSVGVRLQNIVWLVAVSLAWLFYTKNRPRQWLAWLAGWVLPLSGLVVVNYHRLGEATPFTYGAGLSNLPLLKWFSSPDTVLWFSLAAAGGLLFFIYWRRLSRIEKGSHFLRVLLPLLGAVAVCLCFSDSRKVLLDYLGRLAFFFMDPAFGPAGMVSAGGHTGAWGQEYFGGMLKKGMFEVMPFAAATLGSVLRLPEAVKEKDAFRLLVLVSLMVALLLPLLLSPGGFCFNPRYLLELAPLLLLLGFFQFQRAPRTVLLGGLLGGLLLALPMVLSAATSENRQQGIYLLLVAMTLVAGQVVILLLEYLRSTPGSALGSIKVGVLATALAFGTMIQLGCDWSRTMVIRQNSYNMSRALATALPERALLFVWETRKDVFSPLKLEKDLWIAALRAATPGVDSLVDTALDLNLRFRDDSRYQKDPPVAIADRPVFVLANAIPDRYWNDVFAPRRPRLSRVGDLYLYRLPAGD